MTLRVDPEALRTFAGSLSGISDQISRFDGRSPFEGAESAIPGTDLAGIATRGGHAIASALSSVTARISEISEIARGNANDYEVTEGEFRARLADMDGGS